MKVTDTKHVAIAPVPVRVHVPPGVNATVPVGVVAPVVAVSVTVAVHEVDSPITTVEGVHATERVVPCIGTWLTCRLTVLLLVRWFALPLYVAVIVSVLGTVVPDGV